MRHGMEPERELQKSLVDHLEAALAIADELHESSASFAIETTMDLIRAGDIEWLREGLR
jgi:hypothetical protein